jgi:hypothetical protein
VRLQLPAGGVRGLAPGAGYYDDYAE